MECPRCKSRTLVLQKTKRVCKLPECFFEDQHPISFENDVRHYQGQKNGENRFSSFYNSALDNGGISMDKEANFDKQLKKGQKFIKDICLLLKLNPRIQSTAEARFITILRMRMNAKMEEEKEASLTNGQKKQEPKKKEQSFSLKEYACYSVYSACFENENFYEDNNLARWLKKDKHEWDKLMKNISSVLKRKLNFIPEEQPWHLIIRICKKRKIRKQEENVMIEMCKRIAQAGIRDGCPNKTVAACAFWKVCQNSSEYSNITLNEICKSKPQIRDMEPRLQQRYFQIAPETVKKFFNDKMEADFRKEYLPDWEGRRKGLY